MRAVSGGRSLHMDLGWGDLVVMGGTFQHTWLHGVPKVPTAGPRIAVMFRCADQFLVQSRRGWNDAT